MGNSSLDLESGAIFEEEPDLLSLNNALRALVEIFPDVEPEVFREMLSQVSADSRLEIVTMQLLKNDTKWIRGRYRRLAKPDESSLGGKLTARRRRPTQALLVREDVFRNETYKIAVKKALYEEFKGLSHSAIKAVLAEQNYYYTTSRIELLAIVSKSWRFSVSIFLFRRKTPSTDPNLHPFLQWTAQDKKRLSPRLISTLNPELDDELFRTLVAPILAKEKEAQEIVDFALAHNLRDKESNEAGETYDCECCYSSVTVDNMAACDDQCHFLCFRCISHTVNEAIYGQGWTKSIDVVRGTVRCVAPCSDGECSGCIPFEMVYRAVTEKTTGKQTMQKLEDRIASESIAKAHLPLAHCPFCSYAEVDELHLGHAWKLRKSLENVLISSWAVFMLYSTDTLGYFTAICACIFTSTFFFPSPLTASLTRLAAKSRGLRFSCRSLTCSKKSCMRCHSLWRDPHECYSSQLASLQQTLESAMTSAIKRTCPKCNVSFVKSAGCNRLVCVCGYQMCYLCRHEIGKEGYEHFCQHFRATGGSCKQCEKCDLYRAEDEVEVIKRARESAEKQWWQSEGKGVSKDLVQHQPLVGRSWWDWSTWEEWLDTVLERVVILDSS
ncbi:hypothetical protein EJ08DRAFT_58885 [Tothia fuscella]|uniref:RING-type domain-containing protein n=1 Tax=Tothia fuscella TaxID=1048955 RepID=A0A9P4NXI2_9PEZI|nr:hypothetical protein EJ08DRAFT_58885 [Tothia fuscella]